MDATSSDRGRVRLSARTVGVMGSGTAEHDDCARPLGELIAALGANLLTGGGHGVMRAVSRAFTRYPGERGICIGIIPCASEDDRRTPKAGYPNEFVELPIYTHLPRSGPHGADDLSRNHINILTSDAVIALPGSEGTESEVALAVRYGKPIVAFAASADAVSRFDSAVRRLLAIEDVEVFLRATFRSS
jgi:uncharacterized protein (TIGR00725 family)